MVIKCSPHLGEEWISTVRISTTKKRKQKKVTNRSHWTEEYSNWFDICTGGVQPHTTWSKEKTSECKDRAVKLTLIRTAETKKGL